MKIAVLGATGHIATACRNMLPQVLDAEFYLFTRNRANLAGALEYSEFAGNSYDVVINGISIGAPADVANRYAHIWEITESYDNMVIDYLKKHHDTLYINFSSGAVYGDIFDEAPAAVTARYNVNNMRPGDYYSVAKLNSEAKHRSYPDLNIVDIRVFAFFSRYINLSHNYLLCDIINALRADAVLRTDSVDFYRDYINPVDLAALIAALVKEKRVNATVDAVSAAPVRKFEILDYFKSAYGLRYEVANTVQASVTGVKHYYYSTNNNPYYTASIKSIDTISAEAGYLLK